MSSQPNHVSRRKVLQTGAAASALAATAALPTIAAGPNGGGAGHAATPAGGPLQLARVWPTAAGGLDWADDTHRVFDDGSLEVLLWPGDLARLEATGLRFEITVVDLVARDAAAAKSARGVSGVARQPGETSTGDYRHLADFEADLKALADKYPDKTRLVTLPHRSYEGRTIHGLEIATDVQAKDGRPVIYNDGVHHAREWPAAEVPIMWAYDLLENYGKDDRITAIVDNTRNIVVPVVNPDGFNHSREFPIGLGTSENGIPASTPLLGGNGPEAIHGQGRYWRKNRRRYADAGFDDGWQEVTVETQGVDVYGVDANRNYPYDWGGDGSAATTNDQTHRGWEPFSEPEARNVGWVMKTRHVTASISHHTSGDLVLWAWGTTTEDAPDNELLEGLGRAMAEYNGYVPQKGIQLYVTTGTASDYFYGSLGSVGYTFEHAGDSFHPPYAETVPAMYAKNRDALIMLAEEVGLKPELRPDVELPEVYTEYWSTGTLNHAIIKGKIVDARGNGIPARLKTYKRYDVRLWKGGDATNPRGVSGWEEIFEAEMEAGLDGTFEWHVNPSTQPMVEWEYGEEFWEFSAFSDLGGVTRKLMVRRGEVVDLGTIVLS